MYQQINLAGHTAIGSPQNLPDRFVGLANESLADLTFTGIEEFVGTGFWPVNTVELDPKTEAPDNSVITINVVDKTVTRGKRAKTAEEIEGAALLVRHLIPAISDRQFAEELAFRGMITREQARAWVKVGDMPPQLSALVDAIEDEDVLFETQMRIEGATEFKRLHPATIALGAEMGLSPVEIDEIWIAAGERV